jgi:hypothetical protein
MGGTLTRSPMLSARRSLPAYVRRDRLRVWERARVPLLVGGIHCLKSVTYADTRMPSNVQCNDISRFVMSAKCASTRRQCWRSWGAMLGSDVMSNSYNFFFGRPTAAQSRNRAFLHRGASAVPSLLERVEICVGQGSSTRVSPGIAGPGC